MTRGPPSAPGLEHRWYLDIGGLRMHVAQAGTGEPLVMLHGWPQHWYEFRHLIPVLSARYRVICPDLRGFGHSEAPATGYEAVQLVRDVLGLLDALEVDRFRLIGHDWGSIIGFMLCLDAPGRAGCCPTWCSEPPTCGRLRARGRRGPSGASGGELGPMIAGRYQREWLTTPTLFLHGAEDGCIDPVLARPAQRNAPGMTVELLPGVGHFLPEEAPGIVISRALEFFG